MSAIVGLHHVQMSYSAGSEDTPRQFDGQVLGMTEVSKPPVLAARGGVWFRAGSCEIHCGVEDPFTPARKAHPGIAVSDVDALALAVGESGMLVRFDDNVPGVWRFHTGSGGQPTGVPTGPNLTAARGARKGTAFDPAHR